MKFIEFKIKCLEDIKVTSALNVIDTTESLSYISGSVIRGAFISNYIKKFNIKDIHLNEESRKWFFENKLEFLNGYIENGGKRSYPIMQGLYASSNGIINYHEDKAVEVKSAVNEKIKESDKKLSVCEFINFNNEETLKGISIEKLFNLHIRKGENKQMFRYEAIKRGQIFKGIIKADINDEEVNKVKEILSSDDYYIGGSKGSGYGKVKIIDIIVKDENPETINTEDIKKEFVIYTTSDGIYLDDYGISEMYINEKYLEENLNISNVKLIASASDEVLVGGYNKKWDSRLPQYTAVKKGSIFKYSFDGVINKEILSKLESNSYGLRTEEGFGRFIILPNLNIDKIQKFNIESSKEKLRKINYSDEEKEQLQFIVNSLAKKKIESKMKEIIVDNYGRSKEVKNNQIGKLIQLLSLAQKKSKIDGIKTIKEYFEHLENTGRKEEGKDIKRINQKALNQIKDLKIGSKNARDFILNEINNLTLDKFISQYSLNSIKIDKTKPQFTEEEVYVYKMIELENTFRYILRKEEKK